MKRKPKEINQCLKAKEYINKPDGTVVLTGTINSIKDIETKFDKKDDEGKTVITIKTHDEEEILIDVFVNNFSMTNLVKAFGEEDKHWINKQVMVTKETDKTFNNPMLIIRENTENV